MGCSPEAHRLGTLSNRSPCLVFKEQYPHFALCILFHFAFYMWRTSPAAYIYMEGLKLRTPPLQVPASRPCSGAHARPASGCEESASPAAGLPPSAAVSLFCRQLTFRWAFFKLCDGTDENISQDDNIHPHLIKPPSLTSRLIWGEHA